MGCLPPPILVPRPSSPPRIHPSRRPHPLIPALSLLSSSPSSSQSPLALVLIRSDVRIPMHADVNPESRLLLFHHRECAQSGGRSACGASSASAERCAHAANSGVRAPPCGAGRRARRRLRLGVDVVACADPNPAGCRHTDRLAGKGCAVRSASARLPLPPGVLLQRRRQPTKSSPSAVLCASASAPCGPSWQAGRVLSWQLWRSARPVTRSGGRSKK